MELGDKLIAEEEERNLAKYEQARKDAESELRYAGKFKSAEDLEKAYKELESNLERKKKQVLKKAIQRKILPKKLSKKTLLPKQLSFSKKLLTNTLVTPIN